MRYTGYYCWTVFTRSGERRARPEAVPHHADDAEEDAARQARGGAGRGEESAGRCRGQEDGQKPCAGVCEVRVPSAGAGRKHQL